MRLMLGLPRLLQELRSGWVDFLLSLRARCCPEGAARVRNGFGNARDSGPLFALGVGFLHGYRVSVVRQRAEKLSQEKLKNELDGSFYISRSRMAIPSHPSQRWKNGTRT